MHTSNPASLLVAALVMLRTPCPRHQATAQKLLERAAEHQGLSLPEREACLELADELDDERHVPSARVDTPRPHGHPAAHEVARPRPFLPI